MFTDDHVGKKAYQNANSVLHNLIIKFREDSTNGYLSNYLDIHTYKVISTCVTGIVVSFLTRSAVSGKSAASWATDIAPFIKYQLMLVSIGLIRSITATKIKVAIRSLLYTRT